MRHSRAQESLYWREFSAACKAREAFDGKLSSAEKAAFRDDLTRRALGLAPDAAVPSHKTFGNAEIDLWLMACRAVSRPEDIAGQVALADAARNRLVAGVRGLETRLEGHVERPSAYVRAVAGNLAEREGSGGSQWEDWSAERLHRLIETLGPVVRGKAAKKG